MSTMTLFVDASICPTTKAGGVGAWCKKTGWDRGYSLGSQLSEPVEDSTAGELLGIAQTCEFLQRHGEFAGMTYLLIQSDALYGLHSLIKWAGFEAAVKKHEADSNVLAKAHHASPKYRDLALRIEKATAGIGVRAVRHVKGHQAGTTSRSWVNEQCDILAKEHMRKARAEAYGRAGMANKRVRERNQSGRVGIET